MRVAEEVVGRVAEQRARVRERLNERVKLALLPRRARKIREVGGGQRRVRMCGGGS